jgi:HSP20 family protein
MGIHHPSAVWKHSSWTYRWRALLHYAQVAALAASVIAGITLSVTAAVVLLISGQLLMLFLLPKHAGFRERVDAHLHRVACARAAAVRGTLLMRMSERHRAEFQQLEELTERVQGAATIDETASAEWVGLDALLALFVRLAIAHRESVVAFDGTEESDLGLRIAKLEAAQVRATGETATWGARHLAILYNRLETWRRAKDERTLFSQELATIAEVVRWTFEQASIGRVGDAHVGLAEAIAQTIGSGPALRELAGLGGDHSVDPEVLRLGRRLRAETRVVPRVELPPEPQIRVEATWSEMDRVFEEFVSPLPLRRRLMRLLEPVSGVGRQRGRGGLAPPFEPQLELSEQGDKYVLQVDLPGLKEQDVKVSVEDNNVLTISGERRREEAKRERGYEYTERLYGSFVRSIELPRSVEVSKIEAEFRNGVLEVHIPKGEAARARHVPIRGREIGGTSKDEPRVIEPADGRHEKALVNANR